MTLSMITGFISFENLFIHNDTLRTLQSSGHVLAPLDACNCVLHSKVVPLEIDEYCTMVRYQSKSTIA